MNEWETIPFSLIIPFEAFYGSMCLFALFFFQGFSVHWLDMLFQIDMVRDGM